MPASGLSKDDGGFAREGRAGGGGFNKVQKGLGQNSVGECRRGSKRGDRGKGTEEGAKGVGENMRMGVLMRQVSIDHEMYTLLKKGLGVTSGLSSEDSDKGCRQTSTAPHNVIPGLALPLHVGQQMVQPQLWQAVQLWGSLQQHPAEQGRTGIKRRGKIRKG